MKTVARDANARTGPRATLSTETAYVPLATSDRLARKSVPLAREGSCATLDVTALTEARVALMEHVFALKDTWANVAIHVRITFYPFYPHI